MDIATIAQQLGRRGGRARAARLTEDARRQIASLGGSARAESFAIARRIEQNLRYSASIAALRPGITVIREARCRRRLPGPYAE